MIINGYLPFSIVSNPYFRLFMNATNSRWIPVSPVTIASKYVQECSNTVHDYVVNRLKGRTACLIIDETMKGETSYYNLLLSTAEEDGDKPSVEVLLWDIKELKVNDAESVGVLIGSTILELERNGINVNAYSSDNCSVMDAAARTASIVAMKKVRRVPCASHALNNILKSLLQENCLKSLWEDVIL